MYIAVIVGVPFLFLNSSNPSQVRYSIVPKTFFPSHVNYVYVTSTGGVVLSRPLWGTTFTSLQFVVSVSSGSTACTTDVTMAIRRNAYPPVVIPGQKNISKYDIWSVIIISFVKL